MSLRTLALLSIGLWCAACEKESPPSEATKPAESARPSVKGLDPDLAQAMAAASAGIGNPAAPAAAASGGPPPNGIFAPGAADKELRAGQPPKLTLGSDGSAPRVALRPAQPKPGTKQDLAVRFSLQNGPQGALPLDFGMTFEAMKPKGEEGMVNEVPVVAKVTSARIGVTGAPKELERSVTKLKGAKIEYLVLPDGAGTAFRSDVPKGVEDSLAEFVRSLGDMLAIVTLPVPEKPVGVGAYWMATTREAPSGLDLVTYRLVKVERVDGNRVTLNVNTKRYSATAEFNMVGLPPDAPRSMVEFQALAQGTVELEGGKGFPMGAKQESALGATLGSAAQGAQRGMVELHSRIEISAPSK